MAKKLKVLVLFHSPYFKPRGYDFKEEFADPDNMYTEKNVCQALRTLGHEVSILGLYNDISILMEEIKENKPAPAGKAYGATLSEAVELASKIIAERL